MDKSEKIHIDEYIATARQGGRSIFWDTSLAGNS